MKAVCCHLDTALHSQTAHASLVSGKEIYLFNFLVTESRQDKGLQVHSDDSGGTAPSPAEMREGFC
jgi:hypothetical protein